MRKLYRATTFTVGSLVLLTAAVTSTAVPAQTQTPPTPRQGMAPAPSLGSITGHVFLADTNGPARFAHVLLKRVPDGAAKPVDPESAAASLVGALLGVGDDDDTAKKPARPAKKEDADDKAASGVFAEIMANAGDMMTSATVDAAGAYALTGLKPGRYYVHALLPGYIDPLGAFTPAELASADPATRQRISNAVPIVTIDNQEAVHLDLRIEPGAAISGRVLYDDGSPAIGWHVTVVAAPKPGTVAATAGGPLGFSPAELPSLTEMIFKETHITDDRGSYRVAGLTAGDYIVSATLTTANASGGGALTGGQMRLTVFSGDGTREQDAKPVSVAAGEDRRGEDLVMPLSSLHFISGNVLALSGGQPANSGSVQMYDDADPSILNMQVAAVQPDGSFRFDYVADGHYTLKVKKAEITEATGGSTKIFGMEIPKTKTLRSFGPGELKIAVSDQDVSGLSFSLPDVPVATKAEANR